MIYTLTSAVPVLKNEADIKYKINIFYQFFIHPNKERYNEILFCLLQNVNNPSVDKIYLLNERIYTINELISNPFCRAVNFSLNGTVAPDNGVFNF